MNDRNNDPESQPSGVLPSRRRHDRADAERVDPQEVLDRLQVLQVHEWQETAGDATGAEHLGPAAEDFYEVFEVGADADHIAAGDADGVAMAAIQGLADRLDEQDALVEQQDRQLRHQQEMIDEQRTDLETLRERLESLQTKVARLRRDLDEQE